MASAVSFDTICNGIPVTQALRYDSPVLVMSFDTICNGYHVFNFLAQLWMGLTVPERAVLSSCSLIFPSSKNGVAGARTGADPAYSWPTPGDNGVRGAITA